MNLFTGSCLLAAALAAQLTYVRAHRRPVATDRAAAASVRWFAVAYPLVMLALFVVGVDLVLAHGRWTRTAELPFALRLGGVLATGVGIALLLWAQRSLGDNYSPCYAARRPRAVVRHGPYRWLRHPMYAGNLTAIAGTACAAGSWLLVLAWAVVAVAYGIAARAENRLLVDVLAASVPGEDCG